MLHHEISIFACFFIRVDSRQYFKFKIFICIAPSFSKEHMPLSDRILSKKMRKKFVFFRYIPSGAQAVPVKKKKCHLKQTEHIQH